MSNKEQQIYLQGLERALKIVRTEGIEALEREVRYRSSKEVPLNVSRQELLVCARGFMQEELEIMATASATTLVENVKLPPSILKEYLTHFNNLTELYHKNDEEYQAAKKEIERNYALNIACREYEKENGIR